MPPKYTPGVYVMRFSDGTEYVGSSVDPVKRRVSHLCVLRRGRHDNSRIQQHYDRLGEPSFEIVAWVLAVEDLPEAEMAVIQERRPALNHYAPKGRFGAKMPPQPLLPTRATVMPKCRRSVTAYGRTQTLDAWARESGVRKNLIALRLDYMGWPPERAVSEPAGERNRLARERAAALAEARQLRKRGAVLQSGPEPIHSRA